MARLSAATQETVILAIKDDVEAVNVAQVPSPQMVKHIEWVGRRKPLHPTAVGKVLLAYSSVAEQQAFADLDLSRYTSNTIIETNTLCEELVRVRDQGYATGSEEFEVGLNEVAAPIRDHTGEVVASISVSGPAFRLSPDRFPSVAEHVQHTARTVSGQLGYNVPNFAQEGGG
jgi:DNA-binding IclR family transcriptional regulator